MSEVISYKCDLCKKSIEKNESPNRVSSNDQSTMDALTLIDAFTEHECSDICINCINVVKAAAIKLCKEHGNVIESFKE
jgi:hypothetical protein